MPTLRCAMVPPLRARASITGWIPSCSAASRSVISLVIDPSRRSHPVRRAAPAGISVRHFSTSLESQIFFDQVLYRRRVRPLVRPRRPAVMAALTSSTRMAPRPYSLRCTSPLRVRQDRPVLSGHGGSAPPGQGRPLEFFIRTIINCASEECFRITPLRSQSVRR